MNEQIPVEQHPLKPFLPGNAKLLMLGSFPPQQKRWSMDFYYPNFNNDMWRITGIIFFNDKECFINAGGKSFNKEMLVRFLTEKGIALYDTASAVRRLNDNASDKFLEAVQITDVKALLDRIPQCTAVATTGQKATDILTQQLHVSEPPVGDCVTFMHGLRSLRFYRMPSSSRAYPLKIENKAAAYRKMFREEGFIFHCDEKRTHHDGK